MRSLSVLVIVLMGIVTQVHGLTKETIVSSEELEDLLCYGSINHTEVTTIELLPSRVYTISHGNFCVVNDVTVLTIQANDSSLPAVIRCLRNKQDDVHSSGFAFINIKGLTLANIIIENCGTVMTKKVLGKGNDTCGFSSVYFDPGETATLVCNNCSNLTLSHVQINNYTGRAFIGIDILGNSVFESIHIRDNVVHENCRTSGSTCKGSGIVWIYTNNTSQGDVTAFINNSTFSRNDVGDKFKRCADTLADSFYSTNTTFNPVMIPSVGAMTIIHQQHYPVEFNVVNSKFTYNQGLCYGAILAVYLSESAYSSTRFSGCTFYNNGHMFMNNSSRRGRRYFGSLLTLFIKYLGRYSENRECLFVEDSQFNEASSPSQISVTVFPGSTGFCLAKLQNISGGNSRLLYAASLDSTHSLQVHLSGICLTGEQPHSYLSSGVAFGLFTFSYLNRVIINNSHFIRLNGPVIYAEATYIVFVGDVTFNSAIGSLWSGGAAMYLREGTIIWLQEPLNMIVYNNSAYQGGAIFSLDQYSEYCAVQLITEEIYDDSNIGEININVTFVANQARIAGNSMYVSPLTSCSLRLSSTIEVDPTTAYNHVFHFDHPVDNGLLDISSTPLQVCMCGSDPYDTNRTALICSGDEPPPTTRTFPGNRFNISIVALDERSQRVYSLINTIPRGVDTLVKFDWHLGYGESIVQAYGLNCTTLTLSIFSSNVNGEVKGQLAIYPSDSSNGLLLPVVMTNCPIGFQLITNTDSCDCLNFLAVMDLTINCDTSTGMITRPGTSWIGIVSEKNHSTTYPQSELRAGDVLVGYSQFCPIQYCNQTLSTFDVSSNDLCLFGRTGILCGQCKEGLSVTVGSPRCQKCPNWWLLMIPVFALVGILIVALLLLLQLTVVQGTINGLVFYANIVSISAYYLLGRTNLKSQWGLIFISFLNLELGFPVCLYDGLDDITKGILSVVFPMYIWLVSLAFVYVSRYSRNFSKLTSRSAVPVLATLIYITYYELLRFSVDGLAFATIQIQPLRNQTTSTRSVVWYYDGNVVYLQDRKHIILFLIVVAVVLGFIFPFGIILTGIRLFSRFRVINKFRPLLDAYCAPYKDRYRFWFGLRLWILLVIYVLFAILRNTPQLLYLPQSIVLMLFILAQVATMPFKSVLINWLDISFMVNALVLSLFALHNNQVVTHIASMISVATAMVVFFGIVAYHSWKLYKRLKLIYKRWKVLRGQNLANGQRAEPEKDEVTSSSLVISRSTEEASYQNYHNINPSRFRDSILNDSVADID